jgi:hypothetical protein
MSQSDNVPVIYAFDGEPSDDGSLLRVNATAFDGRVIPFAIPTDNVKHFIAFLLAWVGTISAGSGESETTDEANAAVGEGIIPIPATSIAIGKPSGQEGYIGISVGRAELVFAVPLSSFGPLGQTLLMAGAAANTKPS